MSIDVRRNRYTLTAIALFCGVVFLIGWDLWVDFDEGVGWLHLAIELIAFALAVTGAVVMYRQLDRTRTHLAGALAESERWKRENRELIRGLGAAIEKQFARWQFTDAETEVGLLLLKGLSHKEIAATRGTSERTAREQARSLYRKAKLSGRSELAAFFLEDLLLPPVAGEP